MPSSVFTPLDKTLLSFSFGCVLSLSCCVTSCCLGLSSFSAFSFSFSLFFNSLSCSVMSPSFASFGSLSVTSCCFGCFSFTSFDTCNLLSVSCVSSFCSFESIFLSVFSFFICFIICYVLLVLLLRFVIFCFSPLVKSLLSFSFGCVLSSFVASLRSSVMSLSLSFSVVHHPAILVYDSLGQKVIF